ncbi:MAG: hypothetical protein U0703_22135 [Anaerolineae bacterium]
MTLQAQNTPETPPSLDAWKHKTLIEEMLDYAGTILQRLLHRPTVPPRWYTALVTYLCIIILAGFVALLFDSRMQQVWLVEIIPAGTILFFTSALYVPAYFDHLAHGLYQTISGATSSAEDMENLHHWLDSYFDRRLMRVICIIYGLVFAVLFIVARSGLLGTFIGAGATIASLVTLTIASIPVPYILRFLLSPPPLERFHFQLYEPNPGSSQVIRRLANVYDTFSYLYAVQAMIFSFSALLTVSMAFYVVLILFLSWIPTLGLFIINYRVLARIIRRAKWKLLVELQAKINAERHTVDEKERIEYLNGLIAYHDYVLRSPDSALNFNAVLNLLRSLLLPVLVFLLVNLDRIFLLLTSIFR